MKGDISNAFQEISRQVALNNLRFSEPSVSNFFSRALQTDIPLFTRDVDGELRVIWSTTGSVSGTLVFTAGVDEVLKTLSVEFPTVFCCVATDDLTQFFRPDEVAFTVRASG